MHLLLHYANQSADLMCNGMISTYDRDDYYIPQFHCAVLVPCNSDDPEHRTPSENCWLVVCTGFPSIEKVSLKVMYCIKNSSNVSLLLWHVNPLGVYYRGTHAHIKAESVYLLIDKIQWTKMIMGENGTGWIMMPDIHWYYCNSHEIPTIFWIVSIGYVLWK